MIEQRGREIPWQRVVQFHKEVVARAEESFFSLTDRDHDVAGRCTNLLDFAPEDMAGPWPLASEQVQSAPFKLATEQGEHESVFIGGPCYLSWKKIGGKWVPIWRPLLYREVSLEQSDAGLIITPVQGRWSFSPLLFSLLDRRDVDVGESLDDLATSLVEQAAKLREEAGQPFAEAIIQSLLAKVPEIEDDLTKRPKGGSSQFKATPWVLFAPATSFAAWIRHLMKDYERLEQLITKPDADVGGLRLLEDQPVVTNHDEVDVLPVVPLNGSQEQAVKTILEEHPLTVISGPPGTGKSQVVVSLLLNAWARGRSVLFASNNNKAVDVVRERIERFEGEFPIAVRAGSKQKQNIQEVLRRTLNMAAKAKGQTAEGELTEKRQRRRTVLEDRLEQLEEDLRSNLPQRIDEAFRASLRTYGEARRIEGEITSLTADLLQRKTDIGFEDRTIASVQEAIQQTRAWIQRLAEFQQLILDDERKRVELNVELQNLERARDRAGQQIGLSSEEAGDWKWLVSGPSPEMIADWEQRVRQSLQGSVEETLEPVAWDTSFDRWESSDAATQWAQEARTLAEEVSKACAELAPKLDSIRRIESLMDEARSVLPEFEIPEDIAVSELILSEWAAAFAELSTAEPGRFDFLPWSRRARLQRQLRRGEQQLRPQFPLTFWTRVGSLNDEGRLRLAPAIEAARRWVHTRQEHAAIQPLVEEIDATFLSLRSDAAKLRISDIPSRQEIEEWQALAADCDRRVRIADNAAVAWKRRNEKEKAEDLFRSIVKDWRSLAPGVPIFEAWKSGQGATIDAAVSRVGQTPVPETISGLRTALYQGTLNQLIEAWKLAADREGEASRVRSQIGTIFGPEDRLEAWWNERQASVFVVDSRPDDWPLADDLDLEIQKVEDWLTDWTRFQEKTEPDMREDAAGRLDDALGQLKRAADLVLDKPIQSAIGDVLDRIEKNPSADWPTEELGQQFASYSPEKIRSDIERVQAELESGSFEDAKENWLERLRTDEEAVRAVNDLDNAIKRNRGAVPQESYSTFRSALRVAQVWITTAQAAQAIPLEPELFDIVVIDEASQCTLTNLLPLMFRGRTLAVIGDEHQLPAIPTIRANEEAALAKKHNVEEHLQLLGHAENDVYKTAVESLPRRRADVVMLAEHFRSHPQIIGFSNRHIYLQQLKLKKNPDQGSAKPVASGIYREHVLGQAGRGPDDRSWQNRAEAAAVVEKIRELRQGNGRSMSLGVVTPFAAQKDLLRNLLQKEGLVSDVLIDTAYGFQGDEKDVILFSPVVAKGIGPGSSRWVESPPNLINVALTRAREALYVICDFDYCKQQDGILRKLAVYCDEIQLLRDTSPAELELFSWMVVEGWEPKVHPTLVDMEVDFVLEAPGMRLVIEVDGKEHHKTQEADAARDAALRGRGYNVKRFSASDVLDTPFQVIHEIREAMNDGAFDSGVLE